MIPSGAAATIAARIASDSPSASAARPIARPMRRATISSVAFSTSVHVRSTTPSLMPRWPQNAPREKIGTDTHDTIPCRPHSS